MIFKALQSELFRFKFHSLSSKILKIPEFNLLMSDFDTYHCLADHNSHQYAALHNTAASISSYLFRPKHDFKKILIFRQHFSSTFFGLTMTTVLHPLHICAVHNVRFATPLAWRSPAEARLNSV